jgi:PAS domain-containing protein
MPFFICPNCQNRSIDHDGREGLQDRAASCQRCGFGFLFELLDDYYPAPGAGFVVCDRDGRILAAGRGVFELTGFREPELIGHDLVRALGLTANDGEPHPASLAREWGVRRLGERLGLKTRSGIEKTVKADFFPAYDEDGGLLVALSPR